MAGRSQRHRLSRRIPLGLLSLFLVASVGATTACSTPSAAPRPVPSSATPTPSNDPKPGGTLRIAGVARKVTLDPAAQAAEPAPDAGLSPSPAVPAASSSDGNRLVGRLLLRQLYGYAPVDPDVSDEPAKSVVVNTGPGPDLAEGSPKLTDGGRTATITLRTARWDVASGRRVTATDELRALKRLCLPTVSSPVRGYLAESVVGYAAACRALSVRPPATLADLDAVDVPGLTIEGDTTLVFHLIQPTDDLTAILALPQTSPLPVESFTGFAVTDDPQRFVGDGPYHFIDTKSGETYALSRSPSWDPGGDPLRHAYVDHISIRGGLTPARVQQLVASGGADLSLDVPATPSLVAGGAANSVIRTPAQSTVLLEVGTRGVAARRLAVVGVRRVLAACLDTTTRGRVAVALGAGVAAPSAELLAGLSLVPPGQPAPVAKPTPSAGPSETAAPSSGSASPAAGAASATPSGSSNAPATVSPSASALPPARCAPTIGVAGATMSLLAPDSKPLRAAAAVIASRLAAAGVHVTPRFVGSREYVTLAHRGGWDLLLAVPALLYPAPRALLAPLLDATWPGDGGPAVLRSPLLAAQMITAVAARDSTASIAAWEALRTGLEQAAELVPLAQLDGVYPRGMNVAHAPTVATFSNADPTNVSLGSTRAGEPARSATPTP